MISGKKVKLRGKKLSDTTADYGWQTDPELAQLDAAPILATSFTRYLSEHVRELSYPSFTRQRFAIETESGEHIGNCTYYAIDETKGDAELGIMIGNRDYWDKGYGAEAVTILVDHIFRNTKLKRIYLKTLNSNARAQKCFKKSGFTPYGRMDKNSHSFLLMEVTRAQWQKKTAKT